MGSEEYIYIVECSTYIEAVFAFIFPYSDANEHRLLGR